MSVASYLAYLDRQGPGFHEARLYVMRDQLPWLLWQTATVAVRTLPDVQILGAQKAGTTTVHDFLLQHPDVRPGIAKESHFFDGRSVFGTPRQGSAGWLYRAFFPPVWDRWLHRLRRGAPLQVVDATPVTLMLPGAPALLRRIRPDSRLVAVLRDPVDRAWSQYRMNVRWGREELSFEDALEAEDELWSTGPCDSESHWDRSYVRRGLYADQLRRFREAGFGEDQLLLVSFDALAEDPQGVARQVFGFLGLSEQPVQTAVKNRGDERRLGEETERRLRNRFRDSNQRLADDFGFDGALRWL